MSLPGERMTELEGRDASAAKQIHPISHPQPCHIYATRFGWQKGWPRSSTGFPLTLASHWFSEKIFGVGKKTSDYINVRGTKSFNHLYPLLTITQATLEISNCKIKCKEMISLYVWHTEVSVNYEIIWDLFPTCIACQACQPWRKKLWPDLEAVQAGIRAVYEGSWHCTGCP